MKNALRLVVETETSEEVVEHILHGDEAVAGRDSTCDLCIENPRVSGQHGVFRVESGAYTFTDLSSRNGSAILRAGASYYEALRSGIPVRLKEGDRLLVGGADAPSTVRIESITASLDKVDVSSTEIVAMEPLYGQTAFEDPFVNLAMRAITATSAQALADAAVLYLEQIFPYADRYGACLSNASVPVRAGEEIPVQVSSVADENGQVVLMEYNLDSRNDEHDTCAAVAAPVMVGDEIVGVIAAWSDLGLTPFPVEGLVSVSIGASFIGLSLSRPQGLEDSGTRSPTIEIPIGDTFLSEDYDESDSSSQHGLKDVVDQVERVAIERALEQTSGNVSKAARILGLTRPGLYKMMDRLGMRSS